jgi:hypothetical protein
MASSSVNFCRKTRTGPSNAPAATNKFQVPGGRTRTHEEVCVVGAGEGAGASEEDSISVLSRGGGVGVVVVQLIVEQSGELISPWLITPLSNFITIVAPSLPKTPLPCRHK